MTARPVSRPTVRCVPRLTTSGSAPRGRRRGVRRFEVDRGLDGRLAERVGDREREQAGGEADEHAPDQQ